MLHISCDHCGRSLEEGETHFIVRIEVYAPAPDVALTAADLDEDHMEAVSQALEELENGAAEDDLAPASQRLRFDLCPACRKRYLRDPLGKEPAKKLHFSEN
jgi:hypothetical protein